MKRPKLGLGDAMTKYRKMCLNPSKSQFFFNFGGFGDDRDEKNPELARPFTLQLPQIDIFTKKTPSLATYFEYCLPKCFKKHQVWQPILNITCQIAAKNILFGRLFVKLLAKHIKKMYLCMKSMIQNIWKQ